MPIFNVDTASFEQLSVTNLTAQTSSILYYTESVLQVENGLVIANTLSPTYRFGGFAVIDSGSSPKVSGSILFDSENNQFVYLHANATGPGTSSIFLLGPETYNDLGNEKYIPQNNLPKSTGIEHLTSSVYFDYGNKASIGANAEITGSLLVTQFVTASAFSGSFSGSFFGNGAGLTGIAVSSAPGGGNKDIQFNDNGTVSGSVNFEFDKATNTVLLTGSLNAGTGSITGSFRGDGSGITINGYNLYSNLGDIIFATSSMSSSAYDGTNIAFVVSHALKNLEVGDVIEMNLYASTVNGSAAAALFAYTHSISNTAGNYNVSLSMSPNQPIQATSRAQLHLQSLLVVGSNQSALNFRMVQFGQAAMSVQTASRADSSWDRAVWSTGSFTFTGSNNQYKLGWFATTTAAGLTFNLHNYTIKRTKMVTSSFYIS